MEEQAKSSLKEPAKSSLQERAMSREWKPKSMEVPLDSFKRNPDGSWISIKVVFLYNPAGAEIFLPSGMTFRKGKGVGFMGFDLAEYLEQHSKDAIVK